MSPGNSSMFSFLRIPINSLILPLLRKKERKLRQVKLHPTQRVLLNCATLYYSWDCSNYFSFETSPGFTMNPRLQSHIASSGLEQQTPKQVANLKTSAASVDIFPNWAESSLGLPLKGAQTRTGVSSLSLKVVTGVKTPQRQAARATRRARRRRQASI